MTEKSLKKELGLILVLLGAAILVVYYFKPVSNLLLAGGLVLQFVGIVAHILLNRADK